MGKRDLVALAGASSLQQERQVLRSEDVVPSPTSLSIQPDIRQAPEEAIAVRVEVVDRVRVASAGDAETDHADALIGPDDLRLLDQQLISLFSVELALLLLVELIPAAVAIAHEIETLLVLGASKVKRLTTVGRETERQERHVVIMGIERVNHSVAVECFEFDLDANLLPRLLH